MNKTALIQKIKSLEGLSPNEKADLLALLHQNKKYGLVWEDKPEEVEELLRTQLPILHEVPERRIIATESEQIKVNSEQGKVKNEQPGLFDQENSEQQTPNNEPQTTNTEPRTTNPEQQTPNHILIEGDNLHALTALTFTHENKIDVIYIDPPYNTGNKDFKYNDSFIDREDSYRHSKWLSFMHKRLQIAKRLLSDKGVIFISIDDNEIAQLKLMCDEVFAEVNFIQDLIWFNKYTVSNDAKYFSKQHDYVLAYAKNLTNVEISLLPRTDQANARYKNPDNDPRGPWKATPLDARSGGAANVFEITFPNGITWKPTTGRYAVHNYQRLLELYEDNRLWFGKSRISKPSKKTFLSEVSQGNKCGSILPYEIFGHTHKANDQLSDIIGKGKFTSPKAIDLIDRLIFLSSRFNSIILDFFAGSGTTLQATMQLNAEDGGSRQCIIVTNNENNIAEEVCYERNKRVINGYTKANGEKVNGLTNNNFRYYKTEFVPSLKSETNRRILTQASTDLLCIKEDCYTDITTPNGLNTKECCVFTNDAGKYLIIVYHSRQQLQVCNQLIAFIKTLDNLTEKIRLYGFSPEKETLTEDFIEVAGKIDAVPLPDAIYNAYRATFRTIKLDKKPPASKDVIATETENEPTLFTINQDEA